MSGSCALQDAAPQGPSNRYDSAPIMTASGLVEFKLTYDQRGNLSYDGRFHYKHDYLNRLQEVWAVQPVGGAPRPDR